MPTTIARAGIAAAVLSLVLAAGAWAQGCAEKGCHADMLNVKYLHGPLAAEAVGGQGCSGCHVAAGAPCGSKKGGVFRFVDSKDALCLRCHEKSESPDHVARKNGCLSCHTPHGSDTSVTFVKKK